MIPSILSLIILVVKTLWTVNLAYMCIQIWISLLYIDKFDGLLLLRMYNSSVFSLNVENRTLRFTSSPLTTCLVPVSHHAHLVQALPQFQSMGNPWTLLMLCIIRSWYGSWNQMTLCIIRWFERISILNK